MNESDLHSIEHGLQITLPAEYVSVMLRFPRDWKEHFAAADANPMEFFGEVICTHADEIVLRNIELRKDEYELAAIFPDWWMSFFLFGTNGAGDYFAVRIDGQSGVWKIGNDCGDGPVLVEDSLEEFITGMIEQETPQIVGQATANTDLEKAFLGKWRPTTLEPNTADTADPNDWIIHVQIGQIQIHSTTPNPPMADGDPRFFGYPYRFLVALWMGSSKGRPCNLVYQVREVNEHENWLRLRWKDENEYWVADCLVQFQTDGESLVLQTKKLHQTRFRDPIRWGRVREPKR